MPDVAKRILDAVRDSGPLWTLSLILDRVLPLGVLGLWPDRTVPADALAAQAHSILRAWGMSREHASITVDHMLYADLHGIDSHGCGMLLHYHRGLRDGSLTMTPAIEVVDESRTTGLLGGGGGLGHVPGHTGMKLAIAKCRDAGIAAVAVRNSGHFGAAGVYASMAAASGFIGVATTTTEAPALVPTFGTEAMLGTNPIAFAAPAARNRPFVLDMATSTAPVGKLVTAWRRGRSIPVGWALDPKGAPVTSGRLAVKHRRLTPLGSRPDLGSHKGYGLAAMVEILSSRLSGTQTGRPAHFFLALDPGRFRGEGQFGADLDDMIDSLRASKPVDSGRPVLVPGDPERAAEAERRPSGIPLSRNVIEDIRAVARASGVPFVLEAPSDGRRGAGPVR